ncbi:MAG: conjugative transposon protein TraM [Bacteroidota bacterium]
MSQESKIDKFLPAIIIGSGILIMAIIYLVTNLFSNDELSIDNSSTTNSAFNAPNLSDNSTAKAEYESRLSRAIPNSQPSSNKAEVSFDDFLTQNKTEVKDSTLVDNISSPKPIQTTSTEKRNPPRNEEKVKQQDSPEIPEFYTLTVEPESNELIEESIIKLNAVIYKDQSVQEGDRIELRIIEANTEYAITKNSFVYGIVSFEGNRVLVAVNQLPTTQGYIPINAQVLDGSDHSPGIHTPGSIEQQEARDNARTTKQTIQPNVPGLGRVSIGDRKLQNPKRLLYNNHPVIIIPLADE